MSAPLRLRVERGPDAGSVFTVVGAGETIGRSQENTIALDDNRLSRQHARLDRQYGLLTVTDLGSSNGTRVNGQEIRAPQALAPGDTIEVGATLLRVESDAPSAGPLPQPAPGYAPPPPAPPYQGEMPPTPGYPAGPPPAPAYQSGQGTMPPLGQQSAAPRQGNRTFLYVGLGIAGLLLLCCAMTGILFGGSILALFKATSGPRDTATSYYQALGAHDWAKARGYLSASNTATATTLQTTWTTLEATNGPFQSSSATNTQISNNTATVEGTLKFRNGSIPFTLQMVKEGGNWRITTR